MKIVFFDGYCSLCNHLIDWLIRIDQTGVLKFAPLQGETALRFLGKADKSIDPDTVVYLRNGETFERSTALIHILSDLEGPWRFARVLFIVPRFIRDYVYAVVARNRFRFMKKRETCRMPTQSEQKRLLK
jgi:predicted DCC family thiol-disulfide oxidoreductase YuxK